MYMMNKKFTIRPEELLKRISLIDTIREMKGKNCGKYH